MNYKIFIPHALQAAPIIREGKLIYDLSMPELDYETLEIPTYLRSPVKVVRLPPQFKRQVS